MTCCCGQPAALMAFTAREFAAELVRAQGAVISAEIPDQLARAIRDRSAGYTLQERHTLTVMGSAAHSVGYSFLPSGGMEIAFFDPVGQSEWRGLLRPRPGA
jgi:hypothetical protein